MYEGNESCKSTLEKLSNILLSVVNRQLVDHLDSGSAVSITEEDRLRTTQSKTTNLSAEHLFGDLDNAIRRKRNAFLRHHSGVTMWKRSKTAEWIKQKTKKSQEILIKEAKKQGRTLRKEEQSKDKTQDQEDRTLYKQLNWKRGKREKKWSKR